MSFENEIKNFNAARKLNILKGFKEVDDYFEKAKNRQVGEIHPKNSNLVWTEYSPGKFDWRTAKSGSAKKNKSSSESNSTEKVNTKVTYEDGEVVKLNPDVNIPDDLKDLIGVELNVPGSKEKNGQKIYQHKKQDGSVVEIPQNLLKVTNKLKTVSDKQAKKLFSDAAKRIKKEIGKNGDLSFNGEGDDSMQISLYYDSDDKRQVSNKLEDLVRSVKDKEFSNIKRKIKLSTGDQYIKEQGYGIKTATLTLK